MEDVFQWVATHGTLGYVGIYFLLMLGVFGLPIPDETFLVFCGYLISKGTMNPFAAFTAALLGSWSGITLSYFIGRTLGLGFVHRYGKYIHVTEERLNKVHRWFDRAGHWALFVGYYIAGVRHFTAVVAGASKLSFPSFLLYAWAGGFCWVSVFLILGYYLGENWRKVAELIHHDLLYVSIAVLALAAIVYLIRKRRARASVTVPESESKPH